MLKWFKKVFKDNLTPIKTNTSIVLVGYSVNSNNSMQHSNFKEGREAGEGGSNDTSLDSTLNVPDSIYIPLNSSLFEYRTTIDEEEGRITRVRPTRADNFSSRLSATGTLDVNYTGFQYMGKDKYRGISAYWNGNEGDAGYPNGVVQVCVRIFDPNSRPPVCGHFIHRFLIDWDEDLKVLIDWLLVEENTTFEDVKLEYILYPGNVVKIRPGVTARSLKIVQNSVLRFCHKFKLDPQFSAKEDFDKN